MCDCVILIKGRLSSSLRPTSLGSYILIFNFPSTSLFFTQFSFSLMATSPNPNYPFSLDCLFLPVSQGKMHGTLEQEEVDSSFLSYFQSQPEKEGSIENGISKFRSSEVNNCEFSENRTVPEAPEAVSPSMEKKRKNRDENCSYSEQSMDKSRKQRKYCKKEEQEKNNFNKKNEKKVSEEPPTGYIHVRARRGEATDSHSLAERARREKISERMKVLQELVPGCKQVTGKALILDEIINYVRSLQNQVEFLSMRLASTSPVVYNFCDNVSGYTTQMEKNDSIKSPGQNSLIAFEETQSVFSSAYTCPSSLGNINSVLLDEKKLHNFSRGNESSISGLEDQNQRDINEALFGTMFCFQ